MPLRAPASPLLPIVTSPSTKSAGVSGKGRGLQRSRFGDGSASWHGAVRSRPLSIRRNGGCIAEGRIRYSQERRVFAPRAGEGGPHRCPGYRPPAGGLGRVLPRRHTPALAPPPSPL